MFPIEIKWVILRKNTNLFILASSSAGVVQAASFIWSQHHVLVRVELLM